MRKQLPMPQWDRAPDNLKKRNLTQRGGVLSGGSLATKAFGEKHKSGVGWVGGTRKPICRGGFTERMQSILLKRSEASHPAGTSPDGEQH
jgi:hypothetical protein